MVFRQRRIGAGTEIAVDALLVEAEFLELLLQLGYIITHLHVARLISQHARAQGVGSLTQLTQSKVINIAAGHDTARLLEGFEHLRQLVIKVLIGFGVLLLLPVGQRPLVVSHQAEAGKGCACFGDPNALVTYT